MATKMRRIRWLSAHRWEASDDRGHSGSGYTRQAAQERLEEAQRKDVQFVLPMGVSGPKVKREKGAKSSGHQVATFIGNQARRAGSVAAPFLISLTMMAAIALGVIAYLIYCVWAWNAVFNQGKPSLSGGDLILIVSTMPAFAVGVLIWIRLLPYFIALAVFLLAISVVGSL